MREFVVRSGGVSRTGVFLALALLLERMQNDGLVDVATTVRLLRTQRPAMVGSVVSRPPQSEDCLQFLRTFPTLLSRRIALGSVPAVFLW